MTKARETKSPLVIPIAPPVAEILAEAGRLAEEALATAKAIGVPGLVGEYLMNQMRAMQNLVSSSVMPPRLTKFVHITAAAVADAEGQERLRLVALDEAGQVWDLYEEGEPPTQSWRPMSTVRVRSPHGATQEAPNG